MATLTTNAPSNVPGTAEFLATLLKSAQGRKCPHSPKLKPGVRSSVPLRLGFFQKDDDKISRLRTDRICAACYNAAVPDGFYVWITGSFEVQQHERSLTIMDAGSEGFFTGCIVPGDHSTMTIPADPETTAVLSWLKRQNTPFFIDRLHISRPYNEAAIDLEAEKRRVLQEIQVAIRAGVKCILSKEADMFFSRELLFSGIEGIQDRIMSIPQGVELSDGTSSCPGPRNESNQENKKKTNSAVRRPKRVDSSADNDTSRRGKIEQPTSSRTKKRSVPEDASGGHSNDQEQLAGMNEKKKTFADKPPRLDRQTGKLTTKTSSGNPSKKTSPESVQAQVLVDERVKDAVHAKSKDRVLSKEGPDANILSQAQSFYISNPSPVSEESPKGMVLQEASSEDDLETRKCSSKGKQEAGLLAKERPAKSSHRNVPLLEVAQQLKSRSVKGTKQTRSKESPGVEKVTPGKETGKIGTAKQGRSKTTTSTSKKRTTALDAKVTSKEPALGDSNAGHTECKKDTKAPQYQLSSTDLTSQQVSLTVNIGGTQDTSAGDGRLKAVTSDFPGNRKEPFSNDMMNSLYSSQSQARQLETGSAVCLVAMEQIQTPPLVLPRSITNASTVPRSDKPTPPQPALSRHHAPPAPFQSMAHLLPRSTSPLPSRSVPILPHQSALSLPAQYASPPPPRSAKPLPSRLVLPQVPYHTKPPTHFGPAQPPLEFPSRRMRDATKESGAAMLPQYQHLQQAPDLPQDSVTFHGQMTPLTSKSRNSKGAISGKELYLGQHSNPNISPNSRSVPLRKRNTERRPAYQDALGGMSQRTAERGMARPYHSISDSRSRLPKGPPVGTRIRRRTASARVATNHQRPIMNRQPHRATNRQRYPGMSSRKEPRSYPPSKICRKGRSGGNTVPVRRGGLVVKTPGTLSRPPQPRRTKPRVASSNDPTVSSKAPAGMGPPSRGGPMATPSRPNHPAVLATGPANLSFPKEMSRQKSQAPQSFQGQTPHSYMPFSSSKGAPTTSQSQVQSERSYQPSPSHPALFKGASTAEPQKLHLAQPLGHAGSPSQSLQDDVRSMPVNPILGPSEEGNSSTAAHNAFHMGNINVAVATAIAGAGVGALAGAAAARALSSHSEDDQVFAGDSGDEVIPDIHAHESGWSDATDSEFLNEDDLHVEPQSDHGYLDDISDLEGSHYASGSDRLEDIYDEHEDAISEAYNERNHSYDTNAYDEQVSEWDDEEDDVSISSEDDGLSEEESSEHEEFTESHPYDDSDDEEELTEHSEQSEDEPDQAQQPEFAHEDYYSDAAYSEQEERSDSDGSENDELGYGASSYDDSDVESQDPGPEYDEDGLEDDGPESDEESGESGLASDEDAEEDVSESEAEDDDDDDDDNEDDDDEDDDNADDDDEDGEDDEGDDDDDNDDNEDDEDDNEDDEDNESEEDESEFEESEEEEPGYEESEDDGPAYNQPYYDGQGYDEQSYDEPVYDEPDYNQPYYAEPDYDEEYY